MKAGQRWLAFDADFYGKPFTDGLQRRFGWAGVGVWLAFICACKQAPVPGQISYVEDAEALAQMRVLGRPLVDDDGKPWSLDELWRYTGQHKNTKKTARGQLKHVRATHWERWQDDTRRLAERERKGRQRGINGRDNPGTGGGTGSGQVSKNVTPDSDSDIDTPPTPPSTGGPEAASLQPPNVNGHCENPVDLAAALAALKAQQGWTEDADATTTP